MNKDFEEGRNKGDEPSIRLNDWIRDQEDLTKEMVNECLPLGKYNYRVDCSQDLGINVYGGTAYCENDPNEVNKFRLRHADSLIENGYSQ
jgi:hypothetical protein